MMWGQMMEATLATFESLDGAGSAAAALPEGHRFRRLFKDARTQGAAPSGDASAHTLGRHVYLANELERSIHRKDFLVQRFFRSKNCQRLLRTDAGRRALIGELRQLADEFRSWGDALAPAVVAFAVATGRSSSDQLIQRAGALSNPNGANGSDLATETRAAIDMDPAKVEEMIEVLRELERRRAEAATT